MSAQRSSSSGTSARDHTGCSVCDLTRVRGAAAAAASAASSAPPPPSTPPLTLRSTARSEARPAPVSGAVSSSKPGGSEKKTMYGSEAPLRSAASRSRARSAVKDARGMALGGTARSSALGGGDAPPSAACVSRQKAADTGLWSDDAMAPCAA